MAPNWQGYRIKRLVVVRREGIRQQEAFTETAFFIADRHRKARWFHRRVREHWWIENKLHYVKDVLMYEDFLTQKAQNAPFNFATIRSLVRSIFVIKGHQSYKHACEKYAHDIEQLVEAIALFLSIEISMTE